MIRSPDTFLATFLPDRFTWIRLSFNYETSKKRIDSIAEILHSIALWVMDEISKYLVNYETPVSGNHNGTSSIGGSSIVG